MQESSSNVQHNAAMQTMTTFGVVCLAKTHVAVRDVDALTQAVLDYPNAHILGGGSNVLVTSPVLDTVIQVLIDGISVVYEDEVCVHVRAGAGVKWHDFVTWCVEHNYGGLENMALIPGTVGAAPIQNIGAYGVEQESCCVEVQAVERSSGILHCFSHKECEFGYRTSIFKTSHAGKFVVTSVTFQLSKPPHNVHRAYKDVQQALLGVAHPTIHDVYDAVVEIRRNKLPDPKVVGNAGSFFKNPVVTMDHYESIRQKNPEMPCYTVDAEHVKVPAAWLIDNAGWKGIRKGTVGVHQRQALVLINLGGATGSDVLLLATEIRNSVHSKYHIELEMEVNIW